MTARKDPKPKKQYKKPDPPPRVKLQTGLPAVYNQDIDEHVYRLCLLGLSDAEIAAYLKIAPETMCDWDKKFPSFCQSRARGREIADAEVAASLRKRAIGYQHKAEKIFLTKDGEIVRAEYTEQYAPDTNAAALWLSNRQRGRWKLKPDADEGKDGSDSAPAIRIVGGLPDE